jgi:Domain of unknown function (DUF4384)
LSCLDDVALERVRLTLAKDDERQHAESCPTCGARLAQMAQEDQDFHRFVFPRTVDAVTASQRPRRLRLFALALVPVAAALALVLWPHKPAEDYVGVKGSTVGLAVFTLDASGAPVQLTDGARVPAAAALRFRVAPSQPCHLWLLSLDDRGQVSRLYPPEGEAQLVSAALTLPGGAQLDGVAGAERVVAVCSPQPLGFDAVAAKLSGTEVRQAPTLPLDALQGSLMLEKAP